MLRYFPHIIIVGLLIGCGENTPTPISLSQFNKIKTFPGPDAIRSRASKYDAGMRIKFVDTHTSKNILTLTSDKMRAQDPALDFKWVDEKRTRSSVRHLSLSYLGTTVLGSNIKFSDSEDSIVMGAMPTFSLDNLKILPPSLTLTEAKEKAAKDLNYHPWRFKQGKLVYLPVNDGLIATYKFVVSASLNEEGRGPTSPLQLLVSADTGEVFAKENESAHFVEGEATLFEENNSATPTLKSVKLSDLHGTGFLEGKYLRVVSCKDFEINDVNCKLRHHSLTNIFNPDFQSASYEEVNAYYAISKAMSWHKSVMDDDMPEYENFGLSHPIDVFVRVKRRLPGNSFTYMSAAYVASGLAADGKPIILVGTGWDTTKPKPENEVLNYKNLGKDADVYAHEFAHQIVYRSLKIFTGQIGGLHEGFADFFTYAMTGNNKLGESVGENGPVRTGEFGSLNTSILEVYDSNDPHESGQFWSACLWEIRNKMGTWKNGINLFDKIAWDSIDYLPEETNFYQAVAALVQSAKDFSTSNSQDFNTLKSQILTTFQSRGFFANGADLANGIPPPAPQLVSAGDTSANVLVRKTPTATALSTRNARSIKKYEGDASKSRLGKSSCGTIGSETPIFSSLLLHLIALAPSLFLLRKYFTKRC